jgi:lysophospholipase L1-like esterase
VVKVVLIALMSLAIAAGGLAPAAAAPLSYVALGDSYTAAPLVLPVARGAPPDCFRSAINYPHLTAAALGLALVDRTCSSATTANMTTAQSLDQPPQFRSLQASTAVVTIGIGGNDNQLFLSAVIACSVTDALDLLNIGAPCRSLFGNFFANEVAADAPVIGAALAGIHLRSPAAAVFVVGYPDIVPQYGSCYPRIPMTAGDVAYLNGIELALNAMLRREAAAHGATYVDTYSGSVGHDACKPVGTRWIEPLIPDGAFPIHPNAKGEAADARAVTAALRTAGIGG